MMDRTYCKRYLFLIVCLVPAILIWPSSVEAEELVISAAASLTNALQAVGDHFEIEHPDTRIIFNFAASGALLQQMAHGAPVDVFASANQAFMDRAEEQKLTRSDTRINFANNTLVLAVPANIESPIHGWADLSREGSLNIAIGNPDSVPAGHYARQALDHCGLWETLRDRLIFAVSVRQVLDYLRRGEIDAGLIYNTDLLIAGDAVRRVDTLTTTDPIVYCIAVTYDSAHSMSAQQFIAYLLSAQGQTVLSRFGFERP